MKAVVYCKLPQAGLGNQLLILMKAYLYAHLNNLDVTVYNYYHPTIGPYLRRERIKRNYKNYFTFKKGLLQDLVCRWIILKKKNQNLIINPSMVHNNANVSVLFNEMPHWSDFFKELKTHRQIVIDNLFSIIHPDILQKYNQMESPEIGLHVRMGDFRVLKPGEDFAKVGAVRTPEYYFIDVIKKIRHAFNSELSVTVFTDGFKDNLKGVFSLPNIHMALPDTDIGDLLHLSKSKIIVSSAGSTFSYWAGFLSNGALILHPDHIHKQIRLENDFFEGTVEDFIISALKIK